MRLAATLFIALVLASTVSAETITVSAAISLKESFEAIGKSYESKSGDRLIFNFDASGKLAQQILQGAPVDAFISADNAQVDKLIKAGGADAASRCIVALNTLVLIVPADQKDPPKAFVDLKNVRGKIAIGDPNSVPAGRYAQQTLRSLNIYDAVSPRLVLAENVRQVLTYVQRAEVDAGIVYGTDARVAGNSVKVVAVAEAAMHDTIQYPAVIIAHSAHAEASRKFLDYLRSDQARTVLLKMGFELPKLQAISAGSPTTRPVP